ncbi:MAG: outer membrane beta-barrel protein [Bacteroidales bacterium]|nr:outer membrane beta-barrel protein [Bacteroidales bacterium]
MKTSTPKYAKKIVLLLVLLAGSSGVVAQVTYLAGFDKKKIHFGIQLGYTQSKFEDAYTQDDEVRQSLLGTTSYYNPGFHLAIIAPDLRLGNYFNFRLIPGITLINRTFNYNWTDAYVAQHHGADAKRTVESVYGEIAFDFKFRAFRYRNFRPYLTSGGSYGFDFASMRNNKNNTDQSIIRLNTSDLRYTAGLGFDFYMRYVKFAIELKMSFGVLDLKIPDDDLYTRSTDFINTRTFMLGFTFEG